MLLVALEGLGVEWVGLGLEIGVGVGVLENVLVFVVEVVAHLFGLLSWV